MQDWHVLNLGDPLLAEEAVQQIRQQFQIAYLKLQQPQDMAIFFRHEAEGRLHCELKIYFSPAAAAVANSLHASSCSRPLPHDLGLLSGAEQAWSVYFRQAKT